MSWYKSGTIAVTNGSTTVTGSGTAWVGVVQAGWVFNAPDGKVYEVEAVVSATSLTLASAYLGSTQSGQDYGLFPTQGLTGDLVSAINALTAAAQGTIDGAGQGKFANGTLAAPGVRFTADENTGIRRSAADTLALVTGGVDRAVLAAAGLTLDVPLIGAAVQANATDATAGRVLLNGAHGLGATTAPEISDFTAELRPGLYRYLEAVATGAPGPGASWFGSALVLRPSNTDARVTILATRANPSSPRTWIGSRSGTTGAITWIELFNQTNILGTAAQSGGVPTGAVIERGSNANGEYVRFADGTQICTQTDIMGSVTASGAGTFADPYRTSVYVWTFPAAFTSAPNISGVATVDDTTSLNSAIYLSHISIFSGATARLLGIRTTSSSGADTVTGRLIAIGRWF